MQLAAALAHVCFVRNNEGLHDPRIAQISDVSTFLSTSFIWNSFKIIPEPTTGLNIIEKIWHFSFSYTTFH